MRNDFSYLSRNGMTRIHAVEWLPDQEPTAVLQIAHGMVEFIDRYDGFATYLASRGFYVVGNDHLGHGKSVRSPKDLGYFHHPDGNECVIGDMRTLQRMTRKKCPGVPYFVLGHSMGSFLMRQYIELYGKEIRAAIIMGTGWVPEATLRAGKAIARTTAAVHGWRAASRVLEKLGTGSYNKSFTPSRTPNDWLTKDTDIVDAYCANPLNTFHFTVNAYYHMFRGLEFAEKDENIRKIPDKMPILLVSGQDDPVGEKGEGVRRVYESYMRNGKTNVEMKLYPGDRHEILNELDRMQVYADLYDWLMQQMPEA